MKKSLFLASLLICNAAYSITLEEALISAYNSNNEWFGDQIDKEIADDSYQQALLTFLPSVNGSVGSTRSKTEREVGGDTKRTLSKFGITVSQNLFNGFSTVNTVKAGDNTAKAAFHKLKNKEQNLIINVIDAYLSVWVGREKVVALRKKEENLNKTLESQQVALETGAGTQSEVALASANHQKAMYERINAETELFTAESNFKKLTGVEAGDKIDLPNIKISLPDSLEKLIAVAMKSNHGILFYKYSEEAAINKLNATRGRLAPSCDAVLQAGRNLDRATHHNGPYSSEVSKERNNTYSAEIAVTIPIFANSSSGNTYSAISIAEKEALKAKFSARDAIAEIKKECVVNWNTYISANAMIEASRSAVKSAELSSESNIEESDLGLKSNTEVWVKENQLLEARVDLATSQKQKIMAKVKLYALTGNLSLNSILKRK
ncbi:MAG: TolC family protein [Alphaproteobacteria bacterium]|nr:TolC family protein [Alphaproteobacteria bacterium]